MAKTPIRTRHRLSFAERRAHLVRIDSTFETETGALPSPLVVWMPVWIPGSYLVREYARHIERVAAYVSDESLGVPTHKVRKNAWQIDHGGARAVTVRYFVYANELTVRTNHVDEGHAYFNGAATFVTTDEALACPAIIELELPSDWSVATPLHPLGSSPAPSGSIDAKTTMRSATGPSSAPFSSRPPGAVAVASAAAPPALSSRPSGACVLRAFSAADYDELCDSAFECGPLVSRSFELFGKSHRIAARSDEHARSVDWAKLEADTRTIVKTEAELVAGQGGEAAGAALPYGEYLFLWHVSPRGRGGLEHRSSTTLLAKPTSFTSRSGYLDVLSLVAHEFFHLWNVKRIRPEGLAPYRYEQENYTRLLWWFEGATSYYDWRVLRLANLASAAEYLGHLAEEIARLQDTPGALVQSLEEASFDAWIKLYRPDENTVNSTVSYYLKGEIVCALLDLEIRRRSAGRASLDDVVRRLWRDYGAREVAVPEERLLPLIEEVAGASLEDRFTSWIRQPEPIDFNAALGLAGLRFVRNRAADAPRTSLGARLSSAQGRIVVDAVLRGGAAERAGVAPQDELIAIAGQRVTDARLDAPLAGLVPGASVPVLVARDGRIRTLDVVLDPNPGESAKIVARPDASAEQRSLCESWLAAPFSAVPHGSEGEGAGPSAR